MRKRVLKCINFCCKNNLRILSMVDLPGLKDYFCLLVAGIQLFLSGGKDDTGMICGLGCESGDDHYCKKAYKTFHGSKKKELQRTRIVASPNRSQKRQYPVFSLQNSCSSYFFRRIHLLLQFGQFFPDATSAGSPPHITAPTHYSLRCIEWAIDGGSDIQVEDWLSCTLVLGR